MTHDVVIIGAGTAGAAAALFCARAGLRVLCLERHPLHEAGARWVNDVPGWVFGLTGLARPQGEELLGDDVRFHLVGGMGPERVVLSGHGVLGVDMRRLVDRLQTSAEAAGAELRGEVKVHGFQGGALQTSLGELRAETFVDASGLRGLNLLGDLPVPATQLCAAAQQVRRVEDLQAARAFFERYETPVGETLCFTGVAGGYSILNLRLEEDRISILTGSIPAAGNAPGLTITQRFVDENPWVGPMIFGGARAIPLIRPRIRVGRDRFAALGDAAGQVHTAHGSGIGQGILAARMLADALASGGGPTAYNLTWQRRFAGMLASSEVFCRFSQTLSVDDTRQLIGSGLMGEAVSREVLSQRPVLNAGAELLQSGLKMVAKPALAVRLLPTLARMGLVEAHYRRYPEDPAALPAWERTLDRISGYPAASSSKSEASATS